MVHPDGPRHVTDGEQAGAAPPAMCDVVHIAALETDGRVPSHVKPISAPQMIVAILESRFDAGGVDLQFGVRLFGGFRDVDPPGEPLKGAANPAHHQVAALKADDCVSWVELPDAHRRH